MVHNFMKECHFTISISLLLASSSMYLLPKGQKAFNLGRLGIVGRFISFFTSLVILCIVKRVNGILTMIEGLFP
jgi:hypothetical protein